MMAALIWPVLAIGQGAKCKQVHKSYLSHTDLKSHS